MLAVQEYLQTRTLEDLGSELGIRVCRHDTDPLVILNYSQIESPKTHPVVRECRGLTLHADTNEIVARAFPRFYNWGEVADEQSLFDFSDFIVQSKEDGSLVLIYQYGGHWRANTRGSFGEDFLPFQSFNWQEGFRRALGVSSLDELGLAPGHTYVCEFCSPWNKVVRRYETPAMFLLTAFRGGDELSWEEVDELGQGKPFLRPTRYCFRSIEAIEAFLRKQSQDDPTFEGVVIRDRKGHRWKVKSPTYLSLHRLGSDKGSLFNPKNLLPFVLSGEEAELLCYFPEVKERFCEVKSQVESHFAQLQSVWKESKDIADQKGFALSIMGKTPFTGILFNMRKNGLTDLRAEWAKSEAVILKHIKGHDSICSFSA